jgi:hypothetical protein
MEVRQNLAQLSSGRETDGDRGIPASRATTKRSFFQHIIKIKGHHIYLMSISDSTRLNITTERKNMGHKTGGRQHLHFREG